MAQKSLFSRGPFLMGLTMVVIGVLGFGAAFLAPGGLPEETYRRIFEMAGLFGGAFVGLGLAFMVVGLIKRRKDG
jgi:hypothetical protein